MARNKLLKEINDSIGTDLILKYKGQKVAYLSLRCLYKNETKEDYLDRFYVEYRGKNEETGRYEFLLEVDGLSVIVDEWYGD